MDVIRDGAQNRAMSCTLMVCGHSNMRYELPAAHASEDVEDVAGEGVHFGPTTAKREEAALRNHLGKLHEVSPDHRTWQ